MSNNVLHNLTSQNFFVSACINSTDFARLATDFSRSRARGKYNWNIRDRVTVMRAEKQREIRRRISRLSRGTSRAIRLVAGTRF